MNINDKSGWLCEANVDSTIDASEEDLADFVKLAEQEDKWAENVRNEVIDRDIHPRGSGVELLINEIRVMNTGGTIIQYPFGYICTFQSTRHIFRGECRDYRFSESSLSRRCRMKDGTRRSNREMELLHVLSNMRIAQFSKFIWQFDIIPQWEGKLSEVNYKALAQHYGFETFLLDLTNDARAALFFATCKSVEDHFEPLTESDIKESESSKYGVIYHSPDWAIDYMNGSNRFKLRDAFEMEKGRNRPSVIDTGRWDGIAYQVGLQPFYRVHNQYGFVLPMKTIDNLGSLRLFERIRFPQSAEFSQYVFDLMDGGKKIYPDEGINAARDVFEKIKTGFIFSEDDLRWAYEIDEVDKSLFSEIDSLRDALTSEEFKNLVRDAYGIEDEKVTIQEDEVQYPIDEKIKGFINDQYNDKPFLDPVGGMLHTNPEAKEYRRNRYYQIYGEFP